VSDLAYLAFSTPGVVYALVVVVVALALWPRAALVRAAAAALALGYIAASTYGAPALVARALARPYHRFGPADVPPGRVALVIFGAGDEEVAGWSEHVALPNTVAAARVLEAWRVYRIANPAWVISSGGNRSPADESEPSSLNMQRLLVQFGVPADRIVLESRSRDSHEEAVAIAAILRELGARSEILVTSAIHMRRSVGACRAAGWNPVPAIAPDPWFERDWIDWLMPSNHGLYFSGEVAHELLGLSYYRMRGWLG